MNTNHRIRKKDLSACCQASESRKQYAIIAETTEMRAVSVTRSTTAEGLADTDQPPPGVHGVRASAVFTLLVTVILTVVVVIILYHGCGHRRDDALPLLPLIPAEESTPVAEPAGVIYLV